MKKPSKPSKPAAKATTTAEDHRMKAASLRARARLHEAHADMADVKNPPPKGKGGPMMSGGY